MCGCYKIRADLDLDGVAARLRINQLVQTKLRSCNAETRHQLGQVDQWLLLLVNVSAGHVAIGSQTLGSEAQMPREPRSKG
jgi:hypothetical protein